MKINNSIYIVPTMYYYKDEKVVLGEEDFFKFLWWMKHIFFVYEKLVFFPFGWR